ncbi:MAG: RDD family protein [Abditibacteriales bacterium]|nr:RDD family protein [Abditibacteriales bacterium]MDW8364465.1 RDD family protein [Abditibacteriales bacterium]
MSSTDNTDYCQSARQRLAQGEADDAIALLQQAILKDPRCSDVYTLLGEAYLQKGMVQESIAALSTSLSLNPRNVAAHVDLAIALQRVGRLHEAVLELQDALQIDPDHERARALLREMEAQRGSQGKIARDAVADSPVLEIRDDSDVVCSHCGAENDAAANFCRLCGRTIRRYETRPTSERSAASRVPSLPYAGLGQRAAAHLIDFAALVSLTLFGQILLFPVLEQMAPSGDPMALAGMTFLGLFVLYSIVCIGTWGRTLGMAVVRIKVVRENGSPPGYMTALVRLMAFMMPSCLCGLLTLLNCLSCAWDARRQTWHDKAADTFVVRG